MPAVTSANENLSIITAPSSELFSRRRCLGYCAQFRCVAVGDLSVFVPEFGLRVGPINTHIRKTFAPNIYVYVCISSERTIGDNLEMTDFPRKLESLHTQEEHIRALAKTYLDENPELVLHVQVTEDAMDILDLFRQYDAADDDDDLRTVRYLGLRMFNALGAVAKLSMSGYSQNAALVMRDVLETVFLSDWFSTDHEVIKRWREADTSNKKNEFRPVNVRKALDDRDGFRTQKRAEMYRMFSQLAGHPTPEGFAMLRPAGMDAQGGPFFDSTALVATLSELARLAIQVGEIVLRFIPEDYENAQAAREQFGITKTAWVNTFYRSKD